MACRFWTFGLVSMLVDTKDISR